jgi:glycosyltransferase involved in cell wall biosynthesis
MIVAVDTQLAVGTATGAGVFARDLVSALRETGIEVRALCEPRLDPWRFDRRILWDQLFLPLAAARSGAQLLHAASGTLPFMCTLPTVVTVHDVAWLRVQGHTRSYARAYFGSLQARAYRRAAAVVCDSHFSASEYRELVDRKASVDVVYPGVDPRFAAIVRRADEAPFALVVGTVEARKNLGVLVEVLARVPALRIVSVGPHTPYADTVRRRAAELGVTARLDLRGYVSGEELDDLYARAACALVPSRYEGFGYALAEAMCTALPAIAARSSSLVEVADGSVPLVEPDDVDGWVDAVRSLLGDRDGAERRAAEIRGDAMRRFGWGNVATTMRAIYDRVLR